MRSFTGFREFVAAVTAAEGDIFTAPFGAVRFLPFLFPVLLTISDFVYETR